MVKHSAKIILLIIILNVFYLSGCKDFFDFFATNDLDERLDVKDNLTYLNSKGWTTLSLADENDYSFIVFTDTHIENGSASGLDKMAEFIQNNTQIKFAVVTGDITHYGAEKDIKKFLEMADLFNVPCYPVIGNHDVLRNNWKNWKTLIGSTNYKITGNGINLFILDSANSFLGKKQLDWLESGIKNSTGRNFVFTHVNLFADGPIDVQQFSDTKERARIVSILKNKCYFVFSGHAHRRFINETGNVKYISIEDYNTNKAYCIVTVKGSDVTYTFGKL
jgi:predicted phosphodiesterase